MCCNNGWSWSNNGCSCGGCSSGSSNGVSADAINTLLELAQLVEALDTLGLRSCGCR